MNPSKPRYIPVCSPAPAAPLPGWRLQAGEKPPTMSVPKQRLPQGQERAQEGEWLDEWGQTHTGKPPVMPR